MRLPTCGMLVFVALTAAAPAFGQGTDWKQCADVNNKDTVASLIGRPGSSAFRLSTIAVSLSLAGSRFSTDSAPGPFHHGIRRRGGTI